MITIRATIKGKSFASTLRERLSGAAAEAFVKEVQQDMVEQVRRNITVMGGPGGRWPQLSGFNQARTERKAAKTTIRGLRTAGLGLGDLDADRARELRRQSGSTGRHAGYAAQKDAGVAAGRLRFGAAERLRATGGLVAALVARVTRTAYKMVIALGADGHAPNGTPYDVVLLANAKGTATIPARDPTSNMEQFERRVGVRLRRLLSGR
jgi:hypothetical protein